ncbi:hypothetical protein [Yeguia hominis]|uniref:Uncharacterized protein n=1 Tax=Yeguia hominis TaxID=2763662 RepID=A0A926HRY0_9FIRM|nr:hypothetical protein [Yeguia hominis]MBC8532806.1 hypothetical protein [Yeguia hominis]
MAYPSNFSEKMQEYFATLPKFLQESIIQSGVSLTTEQQLRDFVAQLEKPSAP